MPSALHVMTRSILVILVAGLLVLAGLAPAAALDTRTGPTARVAQGEVLDDDLYVTGARVSVDGRIRGDLLALGGQIRVRGQVDGDVMALGGAVEVSGPVGASIRAIGGSILIEGPVGADAVVLGGSAEIEQQARIRRDLAVTGGNVALRGTVGRNVKVAGGRVEIAGNVDGNVLVRGGEVVVLPSAVVRGNLTYSSEQPVQIAPGARVLGSVTQEPYPVRPIPSRRTLRGFRIAFGVFDFIWMLVLGLVMVAVLPRGVQVTADTIRDRVWASLGWGLVLLVAIPVAVIVLFVILIGIPLAVVLLTAHVLALFLSHAAAGLAIGQVLATRLSRYAQVAIGIAVIALATHLPFVGLLLRFMIVALGLGAVVLAIWRPRPPERLPAPPALA
ncbi:MAG: hypothetical protein ACT4PY_10625 [Armatimonadota bacterium]